jgi:hypothetical protein
LVAVHIQGRRRGGIVVSSGIIVEGIPHPKGKRGLILLSES